MLRERPPDQRSDGCGPEGRAPPTDIIPSIPIMRGIFISHSNVDRASAFALKEKLEHKGYKPFLDFESLAGGVEWEQKIYDALRQSVVVLLYATPEACASRWVFAEIAIARFHGVPVIPLLMRD